MPNPWFRLYSEFANDPKVLMMPEALQARLVKIMCLQCSNTLETLQEAELAFHLRISDEDLAETKKVFMARGFIGFADERWHLLNWNKRQARSDSSTERVREHRAAMKRPCNGDETLLERPCNVSEPLLERDETTAKQNCNGLDKKRREEKREEENREEEEPSAAPSGGRRIRKPGKLADPRHATFREGFEAYFLKTNPGLREAPWDGQEAAHLARFLVKNPGFTREQWGLLLMHRARSPVPHAEALSAWIARALTWTSGPTDAYGKPLNANGPNHHHGGSHGKPTLAESIDAKQSVLDARQARRVADGEDSYRGDAQARRSGDEPRGAGHAPGLVLRAV